MYFIIYEHAVIRNPGKKRPYKLEQGDIVNRIKRKMKGDKLIAEIRHKGDVILVYDNRRKKVYIEIDYKNGSLRTYDE